MVLPLHGNGANGSGPALPGQASGRLAAEASRFVGRVEELFDLERLLERVPLVTLVGPPGIGKTRLALRYAFGRRLQDDAVFCELSGARDPREMAAGVAGALGLPDARSPGAATSVARALASRGRTLLLLDNCEHLIDGGAAIVARWVAAAPCARWLVTSRQALGLGEELAYDVGPLQVPRPGVRTEVTEAVELFVDRVRAARGAYDPSAEALRAIAEIVRQLGGVPLAIELAASRAEASDPQRLLPRLWRHLRVVSDSDRARPERQMTMDQAIDWSWGLLSPREQAVLRQCSVFRGGFVPAAAEEVVRLPDPGGPPLQQVLRALREKSLLREEGAGRYGMFESVRSFAARALRRAGEAGAAAERHAEYHVGLAIRLASQTGGAGPEVERWTPERENLRALLEWGGSAQRPVVVLHAAVALDALSGGNALAPAELEALEAALADLPVASATEVRLVGRAEAVRSTALRVAGRVVEARRAAERALAIARQVADPVQVLAVRAGLAEARFLQGEVEAALADYEACLALAREIGDVRTEALVLQRLGGVHLTLGRAEEARSHNEWAFELAARIEDPVAEARAALGLGAYWLVRGEHHVARTYYEHGLVVARTLDMRRLIRVATAYLGLLEFDAGRLAEARARLEEAVAAAKAVGSLVVEGLFSAVLGGVLSAQGEIESARASLDSAEAVLAENPFFLCVARLYRGCLDVALGDPASARRRLDEALGGEGCVAGRSDDARIAIRIVERAIAASG